MSVLFRTTDNDLIELEFGTIVKLKPNALKDSTNTYPIDESTHLVLDVLIRSQILLSPW